MWSVQNKLLTRKGDSHPTCPGSIPGLGGWGLGIWAYKHICIHSTYIKCGSERPTYGKGDPTMNKTFNFVITPPGGR